MPGLHILYAAVQFVPRCAWITHMEVNIVQMLVCDHTLIKLLNDFALDGV